ncbi:scavenger receptor cysteine-rich domain-containing protein DMBT1-like isoform X2 [Paralichthys olivaceus]|uniref:scavenger receptor cysteine-rich domain-containing protein DMBT1-like isoform X2 n=1 Tax=Paralichthys olivaceus TaxID=8255 RepID=UPI00097D1DCE|nr:PREDICTED: deleted in malignant brain tumors 1 protein-like isoform X2 [Paralichthys olivaceus]
MWTLLVLCTVVTVHGARGDGRYRTTAPGYYHTTSGQTCRNYCGWEFSYCSCSSHCQYYGTCCHDYTYHCTSTTGSPNTSPAEPCGGNLIGFGTFSSPNHPNYYHDGANCVWQIRTTHDQRILLSFTYLQLENCCSCDYIQVFDGPSVNSRYLGKVCNNSLNSFYSTSNYMTVAFRSDGSVVGRGFKAEFVSSLPRSAGVVECSSSSMNIVLEKSYLNSLGYNSHNLTLADAQCRPIISRYQVSFRYPINACGNTREFKDGTATYNNIVSSYAPGAGEITRQSYLKLNVACRMAPDSVSQIMYLVEKYHNSSIIGTGRFNTSMTFYTSSSFYYQVTEVPYVVTLNQRMYVQVSQKAYDSSLVLFLDTCVASPSPNDFQTRAYYLVRNGCPMDNTYYVYYSGNQPYARFSFKAFQFLRASESVFIQCKVLVCQAHDYNSRCRRGCMTRTARDLGSEHHSQTMVLGPIQLQDPEKKEEGTQKQEMV